MKSTLSTFVSVACLTLLITAASVTAQTVEDPPKLAINLGPANIKAKFWQPFVLQIALKNTGKEPLTLPVPSVATGTVEVDFLLSNTAIDPLDVSNAQPSQTVTIAPGEKYSLTHNLAERFLYAFATGGEARNIRVVYRGSEALETFSNTIRLEIEPLSIKEKKARDAALIAKGGVESEDIVQLGREFLAKHPNTVFSNDIRNDVALALLHLKQYDQSAALYRRVIADYDVPKWIKDEALMQLWLVYQEQGNSMKAIKVLARIGTPWALEKIEVLKSDLK